MVTRCRAVVVCLLGVLFVVGGCGGGPGNSNGVGRPCDLLADAGQTQAVYNNQAAECPSGLCLKPANQLAAMVTTGATCSAECTRDSDCNGEMRDMSDPMDKRCTNGFACAVPFVVGPLCCKKLCTCKDFLGPGSLATPVTCDPAQNQGLGCQDVSGAAGTGAPTPNPLQETDFTILVSPQREVDILFMVDNSPSMDPKQAALAANFPKMIQSLQALPGGLPDVHIGVVSSDMGAGSESIGGNCSRVLGDRGLLWGNDPNNPIASVAPGGTLYASTAIITNGCGLNSGARWIEDVANTNGVGRTQNYTGNLTDVFSCLATAVGTNGCGYEHQLQSLRVALNPQQVSDSEGIIDINMENVGFLRDKAYLAIVLITDEDDCSASVADTSMNGNDGIFLQRPPGETASLKCAARGHLCGGQSIPGYDPAAGFIPQYPLPAPNIGLTHDFSDCTDKEQIDRNHPDSAYLPLIDVRDVIDSVYSVKTRPEQILVSGIIGWPQNDDLTGVQYQIGLDATSLPMPQNTYWDYMPICTVPTIKSADGNIYKAYGGLRLKKFIDAFGANGAHFSICNSDFSPAMTQIGDAIAKVLKPGCVQYPLIDAQPSPSAGATRGPLQPDCQVMDEQPCDTPGVGQCLANGYIEDPLPECIDPTTGLPFDPATPQTTNVPDSARPCWYLYYTMDPITGCPEAYNGQRITVLLPSGTQAPAGTLLVMKCLTCARADQACPPLNP